MSRHTAEAILHDCVIKAEFDYSPGMAECGPAYDHGGLPAEPPEIEVLRAFDAFGDEIELSEQSRADIADWLLETWEPPSGPDPDDLRDQRIDDELVSRG